MKFKILSFVLGAFIFGSAAGAVEAKVKYTEQAVMLTLVNGAKIMCLSRTIGKGNPNMKDWFPATCNNLSTPVVWFECWIMPKTGSFICGELKPT